LAWIVRACVAAGIVAAAGCDLILGIDDGTAREAGGPGDAAIAETSTDANGAVDASDASTPLCDTDAAFGTPTILSTLASSANDEHLRLVPPNELAGIFQSTRDGGLGAADIYSATRSSIGDTWKGVTPLAGIDTSGGENDPSLSADGLTLYFARGGNILRATRATAQDTFGTPATVAELASGANDFGPYLIDDGSALYFSSTRASDAGVSQLYFAHPIADGGFTAVATVNGQGTGGDNRFAAVTADQLVLYFGSTRSGGQGAHDVWVATRGSTSLPFASPHVVAEVSSVDEDTPDWVSADRCRLYVTSNRGGTYKLYVATKSP
jgi:Tol biopolymer transport system component